MTDGPKSENVTVIELTRVTLGMLPFVLIEFGQGPDGEDDLRARIQAGGGIGSGDIRVALLSVLAEMDPLTPEEIATLTREPAEPPTPGQAQAEPADPEAAGP